MILPHLQRIRAPAALASSSDYLKASHIIQWYTLQHVAFFSCSLKARSFFLYFKLYFIATTLVTLFSEKIAETYLHVSAFFVCFTYNITIAMKQLACALFHACVTFVVLYYLFTFRRKTLKSRKLWRIFTHLFARCCQNPQRENCSSRSEPFFCCVAAES